MKSVLTAACIILLVLSSGAVAEDLTGKFTVAPFGGIGLPMGDMADDAQEAVINGDAGFRKMGFKFGILGEYYVAPNYSLGLSFRYASFGSKDLELTDPTSGETATYESDSKMNAMIFALQGKILFMTEGTTRPYAVLGAGFASAKFTDVEGMFYGVDESIDFDAVTKPFIIAGLGADYFASPNISVFGEATFDYFFSDGTKLEADGVEYQELGTNYYFIDFVVGVKFWFGGSTP
jgi:hypothetical protein